MSQGILWDGAIPLKLVLAENEVATLSAPEPYFVLGKRMSYLPTLSSEALSHFQDALPLGDCTPWFEYKGLPLKWRIPIGVLFDLLVGDAQLLPWEITVHFRWYPHETLPPCDHHNLSHLRQHFFNSLKESTYILQGSAASVMQLSSSDQAALWESVQRGETLESFRQSVATLPAFADSDHSTVPVRLYFIDTIDSTTIPSSSEEGPSREWGIRSWDEVTCTSCPVLTGEAGCTTLGLALKMLLKLPTGELSKDHDLNVEERQMKMRAWIQGIEVSMDTPFAWLGSELYYPDRFLHIVVRRS